MKNKKLLKVFGLSAITVFGLTACGTITAKPTTYSEQLIEATSYSEEIYNNAARIVYDAIQKGGIGSDVLNQILYLYAVKEFGAYNSQVVAGGISVAEGEITLSVAAEDATKIDEFVKAHKVYWDSDRTDATAAASASEKARVQTKAKAVMNRVAERMYNKISGGSYSDRHIFSEAKLLNDLRKGLESVRNPAEGSENLYTGQILPDVKPEKVFENYLHLDNYMNEANTYVVDKLLPEIYREFLNELYVSQENYNTLGRSYARKVNIIEIKNNENYPNASFYLANALVKELNAAPDAEGKEAEINVLDRFNKYSAAYIGTNNNTDTQDILLEKAKGGFVQTVGVDVGTYYNGTEYGDLANKYVEMKTSKFVNTTRETEFNGNGAYPTYVGLDLKTKELEEKDYVTSGWFIKNGGLTELPDAIRSRLFNIAVANGVKEAAADKEAAKRNYVNGAWVESEKENAYVCRINGHNYLKKAERVKGESIEKDILHYDASSKSYYIIEIEEAVSSSKLNPDSKSNYEELRSAADMEDIINEVNKLVASGESYSTLATKKYLKEMDINYHDDSVYEYFYNNYPELFE